MTIFVGVVSSTVPVTSCVFAPAAKVALQKIKFAIAIKLNAVFVFMYEQRPRTVPAQAFWQICEYFGGLRQGRFTQSPKATETPGPSSGGFQPPPNTNSACFRFNVVTLSRFNLKARHSFGGSGISFTPTRKMRGQTTFRVCSASPQASRRLSSISFSGSRSLAAMNRCVADHDRK